MLSHVIWWSSMALEALLLIRGLQTRLAFRYPLFYMYVCFVLFFEDIPSLLVDRWYSHLYTYTFWITEFIGVVVGCAVVFEVYRISLARYPGTARMARNALVLVFLLAAAKGLVAAAHDSRWWLEAHTLEIERVLRTMQAFAIAALAVVFLIYSIPFGRNLRGILLGYGLHVSSAAFCLAFASGAVKGFWYYALPGSFALVLLVWLGHLWSYKESLSTETSIGQLEIDYQRAAAATRRRLIAARGQLAKAVRP
jgi:hypothetical protein